MKKLTVEYKELCLRCEEYKTPSVAIINAQKDQKFDWDDADYLCDDCHSKIYDDIAGYR